MRSIIITGASSGIGRALALRYAGKNVTLGLLGRDAARLAAVADACRALGAAVVSERIDVRDRAGMAVFLERFDSETPVNLLIANAGIMEGTPPGGSIEPADAAHALVGTNVLGLLNTVQPLLPAMMARGSGQIAIVSSVAAFAPVPDAPSYSASKAAALNYGLSLRALLAPRGLRVNVVCAGYVTTPMGRRESGRKPFEMSAERAAELIARGLERDRAVIVFPRLFGFATRVSGLLPDAIRSRLARSFRFTVSAPD